jgi:hypothetical protein
MTAGLLSCLVLSACSSPVPEDVAVYQPTGSGGPEALLVGTLVRVDGCVYVDDEFGDRWLPVFPSGSVAWSDHDLMLFGRPYQLGDPIGLGGGEFGDHGSIPAACDSEIGRWGVVSTS